MSNAVVYLLLADADGTTFSRDQSTGFAVTSEDEAKRFVSEGKYGYTHSYKKITIIDNKDEIFKR